MLHISETGADLQLAGHYGTPQLFVLCSMSQHAKGIWGYGTSEQLGRGDLYEDSDGLRYSNQQKCRKVGRLETMGEPFYI
jgi:hypothetical protein